MKLLSCGSNGKYQLGTGDNDDHRQFQVSKFLMAGQVVDDLPELPLAIVHGGNHTMILFPHGQLYSCGDNTYGQCGLPGPTTIKYFTLVPGYWHKVSCGWEFSILVGKLGVFVCGLGAKGELGLGDITQTSLTAMPFHHPIDDIKSSVQYTILRCGDDFYGIGNGKKGQFITKSVYHHATKIPFPNSHLIKDFALTKDSVVVNYGDKLQSYGKLSVDIDDNIISVKTMWSSIHYQTKHRLQAIGNDRHGQLTDDNVTEVSDFTVGSEHGIMKCNSHIYSWGWGEHGNCGQSHEPHHDQVIFRALNFMYEGPVKFMSCGCATTFIVVD